jgi:hypothetical protein
LIDRVRHGEVVDFILLSWRGHEFPVFNVADMCVTCGVILFALVWTHEPPEAEAAAPAGGAPALAGAPGAALASAPALAPDDEGSRGRQDPAVGGAGGGGGSPLGPVAGENPEHGSIP